MKNLIIHYYEKLRDIRPVLTVTIPLSMLENAYPFIPKKLRAVIEKEGIDILQSKDFIKEKNYKGQLVDIVDVGERLTISID